MILGIYLCKETKDKTKSLNIPAVVPEFQKRPYTRREAMQVPPSIVLFLIVLSLSGAQNDNNSCGPPPSIPSASTSQPNLEEYPVGSNVTYSCDFGYIPDSNSRTSHCRRIRRKPEWTEVEMSCIPRSCGDPGYVTNGRRVGSLFTFPNAVTFECDEGYKIRGTAKRYCQASGSWSGRLPRCEAISCSPPEHPKNGRVVYSSLDYGTELHFECDKGFRPESDEPVTCTSEGTWSQTVDCVEVACKVPQAPEYGSVNIINSGDRPREGSIAVFACEGERQADGPTTSKCLDIGKWTFPAPKCLKPCAVPFVPNGKIGRWVPRSYGRSAEFKEIEVESRLEDNEKLFLHCNKGYDPMGSENWQAMVACEKGKWAEEPYCEPASCRSDPPTSENSEPAQTTAKHGSTLTYWCASDFKMIEDANVICEFGNWKGTAPICRDTRCSTRALNFNGLKTGSKIYYRNGEWFRIECNSRYEVSKRGNGIMTCEDGVWVGPMPPCTAASCTVPPPSISHGKVISFDYNHSSIARYACDDTYVLKSGGTKVECLFGEWKGQPPRCKDSSCAFSDLGYRSGISDETQASTSSGSELQVICKEGYSLKRRRPLCVEGEWTRNSQSPCEESDCVVRRIDKGKIQIARVGDSYFSFRHFKYVRDVTFETLPLGITIPPGEVVYLGCRDGYTFQGQRGEHRFAVSCKKGRWDPDAVCLITGSVYRPTTTAPRVTHANRWQENAFVPQRTAASTTSTTSLIEVIATSTSSTRTVDLEEPPAIPDSVPEDKCSCTMTVDDENLVAYVADKILRIGDRVQNGSVVKFRCKDVGFQRLAGPVELVCQNCQSWHSSEFPTCSQPTPGDTVIVYEGNVKTTLNGSLEIQKEEGINLVCIAIEKAEYPRWTVPSINKAKSTGRKVDRGADILYVTDLKIENPSFEDEGTYSCAIGESRQTAVHVVVVDPTVRCLKFQEEENLVIEYEEELRVKSKAIFSCSSSSLMLAGSPVLTCLSNGKWSDPPPRCINITCRELEQTELMQVSYTDGQKVGSVADIHCFSPARRIGGPRTRCQEDGEWFHPIPTCKDITCREVEDTDLMTVSYTDGQKVGSYATFHCFSPGQRMGVARTKCQENGEWAHTMPTCKTPPCVLGDLFSKIPQDIEPAMQEITKNSVPYNHTVRVVCKDGTNLIAKSLPKCGKDGEWIVESLRCIEGCGEVETPPGSKLIITPQQAEYKLGDSVTFSCPPGETLSNELVLMMCLASGWSNEDIPHCTETSAEDNENVH